MDPRSTETTPENDPASTESRYPNEKPPPRGHPRVASPRPRRALALPDEKFFVALLEEGLR